MGTLPGVGAAIRASLAEQQMNGGTPLVEALTGWGQYMTTWATANPTHRAVIVVATDGIPDSACSGSTPSNSIPNAETVATGLAQGTLFPGAPPVLVFVIGVGSDLSALNSVAAAGGSTQATLLSTGADLDTQFIAALNAIRTQTLTCDYPIPSVPNGSIDYDEVNVTFTQGASTETLVYVDNAGDCSLATGTGWYFDDPTAPTKVVLCPDTCNTVSTATQAAVNVVFGCARVTVK